MEKPILYTSDTRVSCSGETDSMHPLIYLDLQREGKVSCPYCGVMFVYRRRVDDSES
ncbi:zinc-finger domain-containing protein [Neorickettsia helminthoeca]|uniref:zinc-finger domain-containing protein n=1 Tax=Neorickettsia helminthoeca TaxID=33994 RepID=UPI000A06ACB4|nr:zinc-finger domain-containing protein [Neorickettsia helminthoeca]